MHHPWRIWTVFALSSALLLGVMGWVSSTALRLEKAQAQAQAQADVEEKVRLALWRMDSMLAPLIAQEVARPYFAYGAFHPSERAYGRMFNLTIPSDALMPSPLLTQVSTNVLLHFQFGPDGRLTSPQVPEGTERELAERHLVSAARIEAAAGRLREFEQILGAPALPQSAAMPGALAGDPPAAPARNRDLLLAAAPRSDPGEGLVPAHPPGTFPEQPRPEDSQGRATGQQAVARQNVQNLGELLARRQTLQQAFELNYDNRFPLPGPLGRDVIEDVLRPVWLGETLVLVRTVSVQGRDYVQGCWLDWASLRQWLLEGVSDLLPNARIEQLKPGGDDPEARMLATLPARLLPGNLPADLREGASPAAVALALAWAGVLIAGLAVALLLQGTLALSERRAAFVSAVTHELRTPLTTFKMYSEMLAAGMVTDQTKRQEYLSSLCAEADRLNHLVENVLAYARLEKGSARRKVERLSLGDLIQRVKPRLVQRAGQAGMSLQEDSSAAVLGTLVEVDVSAVEQILFNLVDNACKHAAPPESERIIHLEAFPESGKFALLRVRDHGRGIPDQTAKRLFRPFGRPADEAANAAPGVGLGLALCRRLGRSLGGDLRFTRLNSGACFDLLLPLPLP